MWSTRQASNAQSPPCSANSKAEPSSPSYGPRFGTRRCVLRPWLDRAGRSHHGVRPCLAWFDISGGPMSTFAPYPAQIEFHGDRHITCCKPLLEGLLAVPQLISVSVLRSLLKVLIFIS